MSDKLAVFENLDALSREAFEAFNADGQWSRTLALGSAVAMLSDALDEKVMRSIMKLQNKRLGFKTDNPRGYDAATVRDALIEAVAMGLSPVGNQFNIIGGNMYVTKEGVTMLLRKLPGLSALKLSQKPAVVRKSATPGVRKDGSTYEREEALVTVEVAATFKGREIRESYDFVIRVNAGMGQDAIAGKAERKARARLYNYLTESSMLEVDEEEAAVRAPRNVTPVRAAAEAPSFLAQPPVALPGSVPGALPDAKADVLPGLEAQEAAPVFGQAYRD